MEPFTPSEFRILVVDDSESFLSGVSALLEGAGYETMVARSGEEAFDLLHQKGLPHLALVDINMPPGMDGLEFCDRLHEFSDVPAIMLTAVGEETTIVQAIEQHAEDYVTKPFDTNELLVRIRRVLRRMGSFGTTLDPSVPVDGHLRVNFPAGQISTSEGVTTLTPTEMKLLYILMRSTGRPLSPRFIMTRLWPLESPNEGRLRVYVHRLRSKLQNLRSDHQYVVAKRGSGYGFFLKPKMNQASQTGETIDR